MTKFLRTFILSLCLLVVACPAWAANNFAGSNCVALYRFEDNANDSSPVGTNHLTEINTPTHDDVDFQEGLESFDFDAGASEYCVRADADLSATFPMKSGVSPQDFSIGGFFRSSNWGVANQRGIISKYDATGGKRCFSLHCNSGANDYLTFSVGYNNGASVKSLAHGTVLSANIWYHAVATFTLGGDPVNHVLAIRLFYLDVDTWKIVGSDASTTLGFANVPNSEDAPFEVGRYNLSSSGEMHGELDEIFVFAGEALSTADTDLIREQTYGAAVGVLRPFWFFQ